jgi:hypothetical protein
MYLTQVPNESASTAWYFPARAYEIGATIARFGVSELARPARGAGGDLAGQVRHVTAPGLALHVHVIVP